MVRHDAEGAVGGDEGHAAVELREAVEAEGAAERPLAGVAADLLVHLGGAGLGDLDRLAAAVLDVVEVDGRRDQKVQTR